MFSATIPKYKKKDIEDDEIDDEDAEVISGSDLGAFLEL